MATTEEQSRTHLPMPTQSNRWAFWGIGAGALAIVANMVTDPVLSLTAAQKQQGPAVLSFVHRANFQIGAVAGFVAVACVLAFAAGWRQWSERHGAPTSAARLVSLALVASAGAMIIGYGLKGPLAIYLPGGIDAHTYPRPGLYSLLMLNGSFRSARQEMTAFSTASHRFLPHAEAVGHVDGVRRSLCPS